MNIEFTYDLRPNASSEGTSAGSFIFDPLEARRRLVLVERAGFNRILIDEAAGLLTNMDLAAHVLRLTHTMSVAVAHWPGSIEPLSAARAIAALDDGRLSLRVLQSRPSHTAGDLDHEAELHRTDEYLVLLKRLWSNDRPIDHEGPHYRLCSGFVEAKGAQGACIPIRMAGLSGTSLKIAARHASVFEVSGGTRGDMLRLMDRVRAASADFGKTGSIRFALAIHVELDKGSHRPSVRDASGAVVVRGDPAQVTASLLSHIDLGVTDFMVRGLTDNDSIERFAEDVMPLLAKSIARAEGSGRSITRDAHIFGQTFGRGS